MQHHDLAPEPDPLVTKPMLDSSTSGLLQAILSLTRDLRADLHAIAISLESISSSLETQSQASEAANEINKITLANIRAQLQGGIVGAQIVPKNAWKSPK